MPTYEVVVGPGRTVSLPDELCEKLNIKDGSAVEFFLTLDGQVHFHATTQMASKFGGFVVPSRTPPLSIREMDDAIGEAIADDQRRIDEQGRAGSPDAGTRSAAE